MAQIFMICGRICCGKSTFSKQLAKENKAVILSVDEITLLFGQYLGDAHDEFVTKTENYLLEKAVECVQNGISVVLDWGFWQKSQRNSVKQFFTGMNIATQLYYIDVADDVWHSRLKQRNIAVAAGKSDAYYIDTNILTKFESRFEKPDDTEIDVYV